MTLFNNSLSSWSVACSQLVRRPFVPASIAILLLLQSSWSASVVWQNGGGEAGNMASAVDAGNIIRQSLGVLLGVLAVAFLRVRTKHERGGGPLRWLIAAWLAWAGLSTIVSDNCLLSLKRLVLTIVAGISAAAFARLSSARILLGFVFGTVADLISGVVAEISLGTFHPFRDGYRFSGLTHPNMQGATLAAGVLASIGLYYVNTSRRWIAVGSGVICLSGCLLTESRTMIIALFAALIFGGVVAAVTRSVRMGYGIHAMAALFCVLVVCATVLAAFSTPRAHLVSGLRTERDTGGPEELTGRVALWRDCLKYTSNHLLLGYGYESFWSAKQIEAISSEERWSINEAHNAYLDLTLMSGLPAAILYATILCLCLAVNVRNYVRGGEKAGLVFAMLMIFTLVGSLTESILLPATLPSYFVLTALWRTGTKSAPSDLLRGPARRNALYV